MALFKERIFRLFSHPSLALSMKDDKCFSEDVDSEQQNLLMLNPSANTFFLK